MKKICIVVAVALAILLISSLAVAALKSPQTEEISVESCPDPVPGEIFTGDYIRVGINHAGTLGVSQKEACSDPGVGFQWAGDKPFGDLASSTESAAIFWWGEGYKIAYKEREIDRWVDTVAYWQPGFGFPPRPESNIVLESERLIINDKQKAVKEIKVRTADKKLLITFTFTLLKQYPELNLQTTIMNAGRVPVRDVVYTRIIDWDVCTDVVNNWASTGHEAYAWDVCTPLSSPDDVAIPKMVQLTIAGHDGTFMRAYRLLDNPVPIVNYVDLYAWDDMTVRRPNLAVQSFVPVPDVDYNAGVYYKIGELRPGESKTVYTVYQSNFPMAKEPVIDFDEPALEEAPEPVGQNR